MIFRQLFESVSSTYTYLIGSRPGGEALIIDPVIEKVDHYVRLLGELDLRLVKAVDTHVHADHISALGALRDRTRCVTVMGRKSGVDLVGMRVEDGDTIEIEDIAFDVLYTPGHTDDSYCFRLADRIFTGDTLLIRGTGRTDFQNGDSRAAYDSLFNKLLKLPDEMLVYPAHDYKGDTVSTIGEERRFNPRLQVRSADEYAALMDSLHLPNPKQMDVAVPANLHLGLKSDDASIKARSLTAADAIGALTRGDTLFIDLREDAERRRHGVVPGSIHAPYQRLAQELRPAGLLRSLATRARSRLVLYCAYGERSALALESMQEAGLGDVCHLAGGIDAWIKAGGPIEQDDGDE